MTEKEQLLETFSHGTEQILGDAIQMAVSYGRIEAKHGGSITKILNAFGIDGEFSLCFVTIEAALDEIVKAIDEGRLEVKNGKS